MLMVAERRETDRRYQNLDGRTMTPYERQFLRRFEVSKIILNEIDASNAEMIIEEGLPFRAYIDNWRDPFISLRGEAFQKGWILAGELYRVINTYRENIPIKHFFLLDDQVHNPDNSISPRPDKALKTDELFLAETLEYMQEEVPKEVGEMFSHIDAAYLEGTIAESVGATSCSERDSGFQMKKFLDAQQHLPHILNIVIHPVTYQDQQRNMLNELYAQMNASVAALLPKSPRSKRKELIKRLIGTYRHIWINQDGNAIDITKPYLVGGQFEHRSVIDNGIDVQIFQNIPEIGKVKKYKRKRKQVGQLTSGERYIPDDSLTLASIETEIRVLDDRQDTYDSSDTVLTPVQVEIIEEPEHPPMEIEGINVTFTSVTDIAQLPLHAYTSFGTFVAALRKRNGITSENLAQHVRKKTGFIRETERGTIHTQPKLDIVQQLITKLCYSGKEARRLLELSQHIPTASLSHNSVFSTEGNSTHHYEQTFSFRGITVSFTADDTQAALPLDEFIEYGFLTRAMRQRAEVSQATVAQLIGQTEDGISRAEILGSKPLRLDTVLIFIKRFCATRAEAVKLLDLSGHIPKVSFNATETYRYVFKDVTVTLPVHSDLPELEQPMRAYTDFGQLLKDFRLRANVTQEDLADFLHLSRDQIQNIEKGRSKPRYLETVLNAISLLCSRKDEAEKLLILSDHLPKIILDSTNKRTIEVYGLPIEFIPDATVQRLPLETFDNYGLLLRAMRLRSGATQSEVAQIIRLSKSPFIATESGRSRPRSVDTVLRTVTALCHSEEEAITLLKLSGLVDTSQQEDFSETLLPDGIMHEVFAREK